MQTRLIEQGWYCRGFFDNNGDLAKENIHDTRIQDHEDDMGCSA